MAVISIPVEAGQFASVTGDGFAFQSGRQFTDPDGFFASLTSFLSTRPADGSSSSSSRLLPSLSGCCAGRLWDAISQSVELIDRAFADTSSDELCVSFNGGKDACVLLYLVAYTARRRGAALPSLICFVTEQTFPEEATFTREAARWLGSDVSVIECANIKDGLRSLLEQLPSKRGIFLGVRRDDPDGKLLAPFAPTTGDWPAMLRISPMLHWDYHSVWSFLLDFNLPYCVLYDRGYTSIGNTSNTLPNPSLRQPSGEFLPAYHLKDASEERLGRSQAPKQPPTTV